MVLRISIDLKTELYMSKTKMHLLRVEENKINLIWFLAKKDAFKIEHTPFFKANTSFFLKSTH